MKFIRRHQRTLFLGAAGAVFSVIVAAAYFGITHRQVDFVIDLESPPLEAEPHALHEELSFRVAVAPTLSPVRSYNAYHELAEDLAAEVHLPLELLTRNSNLEINDLIRHAEVDLAFVCLGGYLRAPEAMDVIAAAVVEGKAESFSYIIVQTDSPARGLHDLRGQRFLFSDPDSMSGYWYPLTRLQQSGFDPGTFFRETRWTHSHDRSLLAVSQDLADGAAIDSVVYNLMVREDPSLLGRVRVLERSPPFPSSPVVVRTNMPLARRNLLARALADLARADAGRRILKDLGIGGFITADKTMYSGLQAPELNP